MFFLKLLFVRVVSRYIFKYAVCVVLMGISGWGGGAKLLYVKANECLDFCKVLQPEKAEACSGGDNEKKGIICIKKTCYLARCLAS